MGNLIWQTPKLYLNIAARRQNTELVVRWAQKLFEHLSKARKYFLSFLIHLLALSQAHLQIVAFGETEDCLHSSMIIVTSVYCHHCEYLNSVAAQIWGVLPTDEQSREKLGHREKGF